MNTESSAPATSMGQTRRLGIFREQVQHGIHVGGGLLGRVAEFLTGQRGL
jgi:hypothetical protein